MFDVHYHMLFGVDDGPKTLEDSLKLAEASIAEGVTHVVCTPHANDTYRFDPQVNRQKLSLLEERLEGRLTLGLGCDFHLTFDNVQDALRDRQKYTINGGQYLLVEFPEYGVTQQSSHTLFQLSAKGIVPIITHPERNLDLQRKPELLEEWVGMGCLVQVTAGSLLGRFGRRANAMSLDLLDKNRVHVIASDAHSVEGRPPSMAPAHEFLQREFGKTVADRLCIEIPAAIFHGKPLPASSVTDEYDAASRPRRGFLSRLFRRD